MQIGFVKDIGDKALWVRIFTKLDANSAEQSGNSDEIRFDTKSD